MKITRFDYACMLVNLPELTRTEPMEALFLPLEDKGPKSRIVDGRGRGLREMVFFGGWVWLAMLMMLGR